MHDGVGFEVLGRSSACFPPFSIFFDPNPPFASFAFFFPPFAAPEGTTRDARRRRRRRAAAASPLSPKKQNERAPSPPPKGRRGTHADVAPPLRRRCANATPDDRVNVRPCRPRRDDEGRTPKPRRRCLLGTYFVDEILCKLFAPVTADFVRRVKKSRSTLIDC